jgi:hypothetical protein
MGQTLSRAPLGRLNWATRSLRGPKRLIHDDSARCLSVSPQNPVAARPLAFKPSPPLVIFRSTRIPTPCSARGNRPSCGLGPRNRKGCDTKPARSRLHLHVSFPVPAGPATLFSVDSTTAIAPPAADQCVPGTRLEVQMPHPIGIETGAFTRSILWYRRVVRPERGYWAGMFVAEYGPRTA